MKKLLVPTDFSNNARNALEYALELANHAGHCELTLLHTYIVRTTAGTLISLEKHIEKSIASDMKNLLKWAGDKLKNSVTLEAKIIKGDAISSISNVADTGSFDLIIMGTQGASGLKEIFIGSITNGVIKNAETPVLAIPNGFKARPVNNIVFAIDDQGIQLGKTVMPLIKLTRLLNAKILVYHLREKLESTELDPSVEIYLDNLKYSIHFEVGSKNINKSINNFVLSFQGDLLCMIRHRRGFWENLFHQSATKSIVFNSPVPLLTLTDDAYDKSHFFR